MFFFLCYRFFFVVFIRVEKERHLARTTGEDDVVVEKKRTERDDECDTECVFWKQR